jgi:protein-tyrosine phosphatase
MDEKLRSFLLLVSINLQRATDHIYRYATGMPALNKSEITPQLYLGGQYSDSAITQLKELGITLIVNMRITPVRDIPAMKQFTSLHLPTRDRYAPTLEQLQQGVQRIDEEIKKGGKVYIHCHWGEGRGPTMAVAYLISQGLTLEDAIAHVKKVRTFINPTFVQLERLKEFEKTIKK